MAIFGGGGGDTQFTYKILVFSVVIFITLPVAITLFCPKTAVGIEPDENLEALEQQFLDFTGSNPASESVWALTGIYTPYGVGADGSASSNWGRTDDGWVYGSRIVNYLPSQYSTFSDQYSVKYDDIANLYRYSQNSTTQNIHNENDLYTSAVMDVGKKSNVFFTESGKNQVGSDFYYNFSGYRYAFQPVQEYATKTDDGEIRYVVPNTSSLSLIWYEVINGSGIAGQLIITGEDSGVAYLTSAQIVSAFNPNVYTSKFNMNFNGVTMNIYIRIDPYMLSQGYDVGQCFNLGFWSIMVSSTSVDTSAYVSTEYEFNVFEVFNTMIDLLTFDTSDYGLSDSAQTIASICIVAPLFIALICIGLNNYIVLIFAGIYAVFLAVKDSIGGWFW